MTHLQFLKLHNFITFHANVPHSYLCALTDVLPNIKKILPHIKTLFLNDNFCLLKCVIDLKTASFGKAHKPMSLVEGSAIRAY